MMLLRLPLPDQSLTELRLGGDITRSSSIHLATLYMPDMCVADGTSAIRSWRDQQ